MGLKIHRKEDLFEEFKRQIIDRIRNSRFEAELLSQAVDVSAKSVEKYGSEINPFTKFTIDVEIKNISDKEVKIRFNLSPVSHQSKSVGQLYVMLYDFTTYGIYVGDYLAFKKLGGEIDYLNPFYVDIKNYSASLRQQLDTVFSVLNGDLYKTVIGEEKGMRIPKKDWRSYQENGWN